VLCGQVPGTAYALDHMRPDMVQLMALGRALVMWDTIEPTEVKGLDPGVTMCTTVFAWGVLLSLSLLHGSGRSHEQVLQKDTSTAERYSPHQTARHYSKVQAPAPKGASRFLWMSIYCWCALWLVLFDKGSW
jgi:hypothetical protein